MDISMRRGKSDIEQTTYTRSIHTNLLWWICSDNKPRKDTFRLITPGVSLCSILSDDQTSSAPALLKGKLFSRLNVATLSFSWCGPPLLAFIGAPQGVLQGPLRSGSGGRGFHLSHLWTVFINSILAQANQQCCLCRFHPGLLLLLLVAELLICQRKILRDTYEWTWVWCLSKFVCLCVVVWYVLRVTVCLLKGPRVIKFSIPLCIGILRGHKVKQRRMSAGRVGGGYFCP